ncbi:MAG: iron ABC transporter substrate-binding protein, partial [Bacteroidota bacterium]
LLLSALLPVASASVATARVVEDSAGRQVEVPDRVERVFAAGPPAAILLYVLKPDALLGWPRALHPDEMPYIAPVARGLPETGRLTGRGGEANLEVVLKLQPDLILDFGSVRDTYVSLADRVQEQTGIPYVLIDGRFENTAEAIRLVGRILGVEERAERLAAYADETFARIDAILAAIPPDERPRVYLARGPDGLESGVHGSINTEILERAGGRNVLGATSGQRGLVRVSPEQLLAAAPDIVVTWDETFYRTVWNDPLWQSQTAVQQKQVYLSPSLPFGWIDRPPSLNRLIGLRWLSGLFYPDRVEQDVPAVAREFYRLFYQVELSDEDLARLLPWSSGDPR